MIKETKLVEEYVDLLLNRVNISNAIPEVLSESKKAVKPYFMEMYTPFLEYILKTHDITPKHDERK